MTEKEEMMLDKNEDLGMNNFFDNFFNARF